MKDHETLDTSNSTCYLEMFKTWLNEPVFIITSGNILHYSTARALLEVYNPESQWNSKLRFNKS